MDENAGPSVEVPTKSFEKQKLNDYVYELLSETKHDAVVVAFHGLLLEDSDGEAQRAFWRTWKMKNSEECWLTTLLPQYLADPKRKTTPEDPGYKLRVLAVSYESRAQLAEDVGNEESDGYLLAETLLSNLVLNEGVGQDDNVPVILVGHDLGGILIKNFVMKVESEAAERKDPDERQKLSKFLENLSAVFFYATPHSGCPAIENRIKTTANKKDVQNRMFPLMAVLNSEISRVNARFSAYRSGRDKDVPCQRFKTYAIHALHLTNKGGFKREMVVPEGTARNDVDSFHSVKADHFAVCQPEGLWSDCMQRLGDGIVQEVSKVRENVREKLTLTFLDELPGHSKVPSVQERFEQLNRKLPQAQKQIQASKAQKQLEAPLSGD